MIIDDIRSRELKLGELLVIGRKIYKDNFQTIVLSTLILIFPINIVLEIIGTYINKISATVNLSAIMENPEALMAFMASKEYQAIAGYNMLQMGIQAIFVPFCVMAVAKVARDYAYGGRSMYKDATAASLGKVFPLVLSTLMYAVAVFFGMVAFIIPAVIVIVYWYFYIYAIMLNDEKGIGALSYSAALVRKRWMKTLGVAVVFYLFQYCASYCLQYLFLWGAESFFIRVVFRMVLSLISSFFYVATTVWYLNREAVVFRMNTKA